MYKKLEMALDNLFRKLYFPMGGSIASIEAIWMEEPGKKLVTICTSADYATVFPNGTSITYDDIDQVENLYVSFFYNK